MASVQFDDDVNYVWEYDYLQHPDIPVGTFICVNFGICIDEFFTKDQYEKNKHLFPSMKSEAEELDRLTERVDDAELQLRKLTAAREKLLRSVFGSIAKIVNPK